MIQPQAGIDAGLDRGRLVVLGAAIGVFETYRAAHRLGFRTVAVDMRADAPALELADEHLLVSTRDVDAIEAALAPYDDLRGVVAPASDIALHTQRLLSERLGWPCGLSDDMVRASTDKVYLRQLCDELALPTCAWVAGVPSAELEARARRIPAPVVVKPANAQGSRGVHRSDDPSDLSTAIVAAADFSYDRRVLIEEEVTGLHLSVEAVIDHGAPAFVGISSREITPPPRAITIEHAMGAPLPGGVHAQVCDLIARLCQALDYRRGPLMADLVLDGGGVVRVVEIGARVGGDPLGELVWLSHGVDTVENAVRAAVGLPVDVRLRPTAGVTVGRILLPDSSGVVGDIDGVAEASSLPGVARVRVGVTAGDQVAGGACLADQLGYVLTHGTTAGEARERASTAADALAFKLGPVGPRADQPKELIAG